MTVSSKPEVGQPGRDGAPQVLPLVRAAVDRRAAPVCSSHGQRQAGKHARFLLSRVPRGGA